jgi:hypothetical protein
VLKKCKLCQNNSNANSIHIVLMSSTYYINDLISIESSTYNHQFDDFLMYVVSMLVIFFLIDLILIDVKCFNVISMSFQDILQCHLNIISMIISTLNILLRCGKSILTNRDKFVMKLVSASLEHFWCINESCVNMES